MRSASEIKVEIEERLGFFPPFFEPALNDPSLLESLWQQTLSAYVENPLPALFKEKLFAYLSRFCRVPYCTVCHSCTLSPIGMTAGEMLDLLESPLSLDETEVSGKAAALNASSATLEEWPRAGSTLEDTLFAGAIAVFTSSEQCEHCQAALRRLLGETTYGQLMAFLAYVKT